MIRYLLDSSALWRLVREPDLRRQWDEVIISESIGSCYPQRAEFLRSARNLDEFDRMSDMFNELYPDVHVPKTASRWVGATQHRLATKGRHQGLSPIDLVVAATAAHHNLVVLHDDNDYVTIADAVNDLDQRAIYDFPAL